MTELKYKRILLKISGEALSGESGHGLTAEGLVGVAKQIKELHEEDEEVC